MQINRREFVISGAAAGIAAAAQAQSAGPAVKRSGEAKPVIISSANGHRYKNGGSQTCLEKAFSMMTKGGDVLDALIAGVNIVELDPEDTSVGYGGLPNAEGVVQLDACCMHGPRKRAGGVACIEGVRTPSLVAQKVMDMTDHHLIVGHDAQRFARSMGFTIEDDLNTEKSRQLWLEWKRRSDPEHYLDPKKRGDAARLGLRRERHPDLPIPSHRRRTRPLRMGIEREVPQAIEGQPVFTGQHGTRICMTVIVFAAQQLVDVHRRPNAASQVPAIRIRCLMCQQCA